MDLVRNVWEVLERGNEKHGGDAQSAIEHLRHAMGHLEAEGTDLTKALQRRQKALKMIDRYLKKDRVGEAVSCSTVVEKLS